jgi:ribonuclease HI
VSNGWLHPEGFIDRAAEAEDGTKMIVRSGTLCARVLKSLVDDKWRTPKGPVKNRDLWERLFALVEDEARDVSFVWVKGHATEANNNIVDPLSREASKAHGEA